MFWSVCCHGNECNLTVLVPLYFSCQLNNSWPSGTMAADCARFQTTYNRDFGVFPAISHRRKNISSSTSNLLDANTKNHANLNINRKLVSFKTPVQDDKYYRNLLGVKPMTRSSSYQNINIKRNIFETKENLCLPTDDFDSGFSSDDNTRGNCLFSIFWFVRHLEVFIFLVHSFIELVNQHFVFVSLTLVILRGGSIFQL